MTVWRVSSRGQSSLELLVLTVVMLLFIAVVGGSAFLTFSESVSSSMAMDSLRNIQTGINHSYALGPGNVLIVEIALPASVSDSNVGGLSGREVGFDLSSPFGVRNYFVYLDANVKGSLPVKGGAYKIKLVSLGSDVNISVVSG
ncbi:MAG: hypothetical protein J4215_05150 [Candidatus Diapherotrites archaeon]|uniref:Uncharacterized protein n=1 Tax=Candidatus Iainarchaeum sp. TaxID=3101447 RepID=A0A8T4L532_9ARCH|nr:hypothetical protein [Candidatus Diapherotrites archaeon]